MADPRVRAAKFPRSTTDHLGDCRVSPVHHSKPIPVHLEGELAAHRRRDPLFDPKMYASQMSKELRRWFDKHGSAT
jgi:hypothetical protein